MKYRKIFLLVFLWASFFVLKNIHAAESKVSVGNIANVVGKVEIIRDGKSSKAEKEYPVYETDSVVTHENSAVKINFKDGSNYMAFKNTEFKISEYKIKNKKDSGVSLQSAVDVVKGSIRFYVKPKEEGFNDSKVNTPNSVMLIRGTEVVATVGNALTETSVLNGSIEMMQPSDPGRFVVVPQGNTAVASANSPISRPVQTPSIIIDTVNQNSATVGVPPVSQPTAPPVTQPAPAGEGIQGNNAPAAAPTAAPPLAVSPDGTVTTGSMADAAQAVAVNIPPINPVPTSTISAAVAAANIANAVTQNVNNVVGPAGGTIAEAQKPVIAQQVANATKININIHIKPAPPPSN